MRVVYTALMIVAQAPFGGGLITLEKVRVMMYRAEATSEGGRN